MFKTRKKVWQSTRECDAALRDAVHRERETTSRVPVHAAVIPRRSYAAAHAVLLHLFVFLIGICRRPFLAPDHVSAFRHLGTRASLCFRLCREDGGCCRAPHAVTRCRGRPSDVAEAA